MGLDIRYSAGKDGFGSVGPHVAQHGRAYPVLCCPVGHDLVVAINDVALGWVY